MKWLIRALSSSMTALLGPSPDQPIADGLKALADTAAKCAVHLRVTQGRDFNGIIELEHQGDQLKDSLTVLIEEHTFIGRLGKSDPRRLARDIDSTINGCRKVVEHLRVWKQYIPSLPPHADELLTLIVTMMDIVQSVGSLLCQRHVPIADIAQMAARLDELESQADAIRLVAEEALVTELGNSESNDKTLFAMIKLYDLLEDITDSANHCGESFLLLAERKG